MLSWRSCVVIVAVLTSLQLTSSYCHRPSSSSSLGRRSFCRHHCPAVMVLLSSLSPSCRDGPAAVILPSVLPLRSWHHRPDVARYCHRHRRPDITLLTSRIAVTFLPPVTAVIRTFVVMSPLRRRPDVMSSSIPPSALCGRDVLERFHDLRYYSVRDKWPFCLNR